MAAAADLPPSLADAAMNRTGFSGGRVCPDRRIQRRTVSRPRPSCLATACAAAVTDG